MHFEGSVWLVIQKPLVPCMHVRRAGTCDNALHVFAVYQDACVAHCHWWQARTHSDAAAVDGARPTASRRALATTCPKGTVQGRRMRPAALSGAPACRRRRRRRRRPSSACRGRRRRRRRRSRFAGPPCAARAPARTSASRLGFVAGSAHAPICSPGTCLHADLPAPRQGRLHSQGRVWVGLGAGAHCIASSSSSSQDRPASSRSSSSSSSSSPPASSLSTSDSSSLLPPPLLSSSSSSSSPLSGLNSPARGAARSARADAPSPLAAGDVAAAVHASVIDSSVGERPPASQLPFQRPVPNAAHHA